MRAEGYRTEDAEMVTGVRPTAHPQAQDFERKEKPSLAVKRWDASDFSVKWAVRSSHSQWEERGPKV